MTGLDQGPHGQRHEDLDHRTGKCLLCNNASKIPERALRNIMRIIEARSAEVIEKWIGFFGEVSYYC